MSTDTITRDQLRAAMAPRSDQLNADDLVGGPMEGRITAIRPGKRDKDPTVDVHLDCATRPWRPCKTMFRVLAACWGDDPAAWLGRRVRIYRDPDAVFGSERVGGIRVSHVSHIGGALDVQSQTKRGKRGVWTVEPLATTLRDQIRALIHGGTCTQDQAVAALGGRKADDVPAAEHATILARLRGVQQTIPDPDLTGGEE